MVLQDIIDHHAKAMLEPDSAIGTALFHQQAAEMLRQASQLMDEALAGEELTSEPAGILVHFDFLAGPTQLTNDLYVLRMPEMPDAGEAILIDGIPYGVGGRQWAINNGQLEARLMIQRVGQHSSLVVAPASALDALSKGKG